MASTSGQAPPPQNKPTPCEGCHWPDVVRGSPAPVLSGAAVHPSSVPGDTPRSGSACRTQLRRVSPEQPILVATDWIAIHCEG